MPRRLSKSTPTVYGERRTSEHESKTIREEVDERQLATRAGDAYREAIEYVATEVAVADAADGRFVLYPSVEATLTAEDGTDVGPFEVPFLWPPGLYHYGRSVELSGDGIYTLHARIEPPTFGRHDRQNSRRYVEPVEVEFDGVDVVTGQT